MKSPVCQMSCADRIANPHDEALQVAEVHERACRLGTPAMRRFYQRDVAAPKPPCVVMRPLSQVLTVPSRRAQ